MDNDTSDAERRITAFALERIRVGEEMAENGRRMLAILDLCRTIEPATPKTPSDEPAHLRIVRQSDR